jgi:large subunit ribosomal protein L10
MNRNEKQDVVTELAGKFKEASAIFLADYRGLTVAEFTEMRHELDKVQAQIQVVKNRLMKRALSDEGCSELEEFLLGPTAVTFIEEDAVGAAKVLAKYQKEFEPLEIRAGIVRGEVVGPEQFEALSKLPSKEELYAKLLGTLLAPASSFVRALQGVSEKLVRVLAAIRDTKE